MNTPEHNRQISREVRELISYRPHWIIRKGNAFFLVILLGLLSFTWFIRFPDMIRGSFTLAAVDPPLPCIVPQEARLQKLLVSPDQDVDMGQPLALLQTSAEAQPLVLTAPAKGRLIFTALLLNGLLLKPGQELCAVLPAHTRYYGRMHIAQAGLGKIRAGQKVMIDMNGYPGNEFGYLKGSVEYIVSTPASPDSLLVKISLPLGLHTSADSTLLFRSNLQGSAAIITEDRRLLERLLGGWGAR